MSTSKDQKDPFARFEAEKENDGIAVDVPMTHRDGSPLLRKDGKQVVLGMYGEFSEQFKAGDRQFTTRIVKSARGGSEPTPEQSEKWEAERIAKAAAYWNLDTEEGVDVPFSAANVANFLRVASWNARKAKSAITEHDSFFATASDS